MQIAQLEYQLDNAILTKRKLRLRIGAMDVVMAMDQVAGRLKPDVSVPGYRKGKAPLPLIRKHHAKRVKHEAFEELRKAAVEQVLKQLPKADQPFLPPEVLERDKVLVTYNKPLTFEVQYMIDPTGVGQNPEHPQPEQGAVLPGSQIQSHATGPMGIPQGPQAPGAPMPPGLPTSSDE